MKVPLIQFVIDVVVSAGLLSVVGQAIPGARCKTFGDALQVALIYAVLTHVLGIALVAAGVSMAVILAMIPILGWMALAVGVVPFLILGRFVVCVAALYLADKFVDGFELDGPGTAALVAVVVGVLHHMLSMALPII